MTDAKQRLDAKLATLVAASAPPRTVARRLCLYDFPSAFVGFEDQGFAILDEVCREFTLPFSCVKVVGSAQLGYSYFSKKDFTPGVSDLDIAIIRASMFQWYSERVCAMTVGYRDLSHFPVKDGVDVPQAFRNYLSAGFFRPDLMPNCKEKADWFRFFNLLSNKHTNLFSNINAGIYLSDGFFEMKNSSVLSLYRDGLTP